MYTCIFFSWQINSAAAATLLAHCWYSFGRPVTIGTPMVIFAVLTVFWLFRRLVHCWYSLGRHVTIGSHFCCFECLLTVFDHWCTNRHRSTKTVPTVYQHAVYQSSKTVKRQSKQLKWPLVYQSSHFYTESAEYTKSASVSAEYTKHMILVPGKHSAVTSRVSKTGIVL